MLFKISVIMCLNILIILVAGIYRKIGAMKRVEFLHKLYGYKPRYHPDHTRPD